MAGGKGNLVSSVRCERLAKGIRGRDQGKGSEGREMGWNCMKGKYNTRRIKREQLLSAIMDAVWEMNYRPSLPEKGKYVYK
jgi:hypothetical protein